MDILSEKYRAAVARVCDAAEYAAWHCDHLPDDDDQFSDAVDLTRQLIGRGSGPMSIRISGAEVRADLSSLFTTKHLSRHVDDWLDRFLARALFAVKAGEEIDGDDEAAVRVFLNPDDAERMTKVIQSPARPCPPDWDGMEAEWRTHCEDAHATACSVWARMIGIA